MLIFNELGIIATGSLRRQAQWLNKYPTHKAVDLRGNVNTRMQKLQDSDGMALFCRCRIRKNQLKASKLYQFRLDDSAPQSNACCRHAEDSFAVDAII
jgi:hydroxymethylbilane synthase